MGNFLVGLIGNSSKQINKPSDKENDRGQALNEGGNANQMEKPSKKQENGKDDLKQTDKPSNDQGSGQVDSKASKPMCDNSEQADNPMTEQSSKTGNDFKDGVQQEKVMEAFIKMKMEPAPTVKKPTLTAESICAYLEHCFGIVLMMNEENSQFLKQLFISRVFLGASRRYPISCLTAAYRPDGVKFAFSAVSVFKTYNPSDLIRLKCSGNTYKEMDLLLSLLKPNHFLMEFRRSNLSDEVVKKSIKHLDLTKGKVALIIEREVTTGFADLMGCFANRRLEILLCESNLLTELNVPLQVGHYFPASIVRNVQLHNILRHSIKSLEIYVGGQFVANFDESASPKCLKPIVCNSLKKLKVDFDANYGSLMQLLDDVKDRCPKLNTLDAKITLSRNDMSIISLVSDADEIMEHVLATQEKIQAILKKCRLLARKLKIVSELCLQCKPEFDDEFSCNWIERAKSLDLFKESVHQDRVEQLGDHAFSICQLDTKFSDDLLEFEHSTKVYRFIPE